jgi:hypothetical protein
MADMSRGRRLVGDRPQLFELGEKWLSLPAYFPSVSSLKTALSPIDYVRVLNSLADTNRQFLFSAFDIGRLAGKPSKDFRYELEAANNRKSIVMMDSGNYEAFWTRPNPAWTRSEYHAVMGRTKFDLAFTFDNQRPPLIASEYLAQLSKDYRKDRAAAKSAFVVPIIHGTPTSLPELCASLARREKLRMVAVPERCLGQHVAERVAAVAKIRAALNSLPEYVCLHLLGTGNPFSLLLFSAAGADTFDGLEWCQTVVDHDTAFLHHFSYADLFRAQSAWGAENFDFHTRTLAHNLDFYTRWVDRIRASSTANDWESLLRSVCPERALPYFLRILEGLHGEPGSH